MTTMLEVINETDRMASGLPLYRRDHAGHVIPSEPARPTLLLVLPSYTKDTDQTSFAVRSESRKDPVYVCVTTGGIVLSIDRRPRSEESAMPNPIIHGAGAEK
jgi:hypothetical protein